MSTPTRRAGRTSTSPGRRADGADASPGAPSSARLPARSQPSPPRDADFLSSCRPGPSGSSSTGRAQHVEPMHPHRDRPRRRRSCVAPTLSSCPVARAPRPPPPSRSCCAEHARLADPVAHQYKLHAHSSSSDGSARLQVAGQCETAPWFAISAVLRPRARRPPRRQRGMPKVIVGSHRHLGFGPAPSILASPHAGTSSSSTRRRVAIGEWGVDDRARFVRRHTQVQFDLDVGASWAVRLMRLQVRPPPATPPACTVRDRAAPWCVIAASSPSARSRCPFPAPSPLRAAGGRPPPPSLATGASVTRPQS